MVAENCCIFAGQTKDIKTYEGVTDNVEWSMAKLKLLLVPSATHSQTINLLAWGSVAKRIIEIGEGKNIKVLSWYNPSVFNGKLQDTFEVDSVVVLE